MKINVYNLPSLFPEKLGKFAVFLKFYALFPHTTSSSLQLIQNICSEDMRVIRTLSRQKDIMKTIYAHTGDSHA